MKKVMAIMSLIDCVTEGVFTNESEEIHISLIRMPVLDMDYVAFDKEIKDLFANSAVFEVSTFSSDSHLKDLAEEVMEDFDGEIVESKHGISWTVAIRHEKFEEAVNQMLFWCLDSDDGKPSEEMMDEVE